jgi:hypothetical protein
VTALTNKLYERTLQSDSTYALGSDWSVYLNLKSEKALAADPAALIERLDLLLLAGQMSDEMRTLLVDYVADIPLDDGGTERVVEALYLIVTSPEGALQR